MFVLAPRALMSLLTALLLLTTVAPIAAAGDRALEQDAPFEWWMEDRYELGWSLYDPDSHSYPTEYLYPDGWQVGFDACASPLPGDRVVESYRWHIEGIEHVYSFDSNPSANCRLDRASAPAAPALPVQGHYIVTLTLAFADGEETIASQQITIMDLLIVSIGDSNASGEGNPHVNQVGGLRPADDIWFDRRCHRSANSGHARAAATIEHNDPHTAVTFLSFACSGAEIWDGLISDYYGIELPGNSLVTPLKPQPVSIMEHLCQSTYDAAACIENPREIDSLFISIGVNDLGFSSILVSCAAEKKIEDIRVEDLWIPGIVDVLTGWDWETIMDNPVDYLLGPLDEIFLDALDWVFSAFGSDFFACEEELDPVLDMNFAALWSHFNLLGEVLEGSAGQVAADLQSNAWNHNWMSPSLRAKFGRFYGGMPEAMSASIVPKDVYVTTYPADLFHDENGAHDGCHFFEGINENEARWIEKQGLRLNRHLEWETTKHRWHFVDGITEGFDGHGYCSDDSYYVALSESLLSQFNYQGAVHPNSSGHNVTRDRLLDVYYADKPDWSAKHGVSITMEAMRIIDKRDDPQQTATFTAKINDRWYRHDHMIDQLDVPVGNWFGLPEDQFRFRAPLADDDTVTVLAHTSVGGGLFYPPKCHTPECAQVIEPTRLRTEREYSPDNQWGGAYEWCQDEPSTKFFFSERSCTVTSESADFSLEVRYRIIVTNLAASPLPWFEEDDMVVCGDHCEAAQPPAAQSLAQYAEQLEAAGEDPSVIVALLQYLEQQVALP